ncbi:MAG: T9SS type A sorting domain-containing protein [Bacteroidales bacterium]|nr:T9SS type A sorting domain-containing protein [Bacteroidales bacterium]
MRKTAILTLLIISFFHLHLFAQQAWNRLFYFPQENTINDMMLIPGTNKLIAVCAGSTVLYSTDMGESWELQFNPAGLNNYANLKSVYFLNASTGFISTSNALILKTTNGGSSWTQVYSGVPAISFNDFHFIDNNLGYACGNHGWMIKTTDAGQTWDYLSSSVLVHLLEIEFISDTKGFILTESEEYLLETIDAGETWQAKSFSPPLEVSEMYGLQFVNDTTGFVFGKNSSSTGSYGKVYKTTDAGITWIEVLHESSLNQGSMAFADEMHGFIAFHRWLELGICYTSDGGNTWQNTQMQAPFYSFSINTALYITPDIALAAGSRSLLIKSSNGCLDWTQLSQSGIHFPVEYVQFVGPTIGFATDNPGLRGIAGNQLWKTTNGGQSWEFNRTLWGYGGCFHFPDETNGFAASTDYYDDEFTFYRTNDCGENWEEIIFKSDFMPSDIRFSDLQSGFIAGDKILKTIDGGNTWDVVYTGSANYLRIFYQSADDVVIIGEHSLIFSTDAGSSWTERAINNTWPVNDAWMKDDGTIFIAFGDDISWSNDLGLTWIASSLENGNPIEFKSLFFSSHAIGYAAGHGNFETMLKTIDGGLTWNALEIQATSPLNSVYFLDDLHGFAFGKLGLVLETHTGGLVGVDTPIQANANVYFNIYPNPFTDLITIEPLTQDHLGSMEFEIFSMAGKLIMSGEITDQNQSHTISTENMPQGIYLMRLRTQTWPGQTTKLIKY